MSDFFPIAYVRRSTVGVRVYCVAFHDASYSDSVKDWVDARAEERGYTVEWPDGIGEATVTKIKSRREQAEELYDELFNLSSYGIGAVHKYGFFGMDSYGVYRHPWRRSLPIKSTAKFVRALGAAALADDYGEASAKLADCANKLADLIEAGI